MAIELNIPEATNFNPNILIFGVGGAGGNGVGNMIDTGVTGVEFVIANTDAQALESNPCQNVIQLGNSITKGLGAGSYPEVGKAAAEESSDQIDNYLEGNNMVFITAGLGGGTGTGAAPVIAKRARDKGILTVGVVTKPFLFEGAHRMKVAEAGLEELQKHVDTLIIIPNQNLFRIADKNTTFKQAFGLADSVLSAGVSGITDLITRAGLVNLDFADIRSVMSEMGKAMMGTGEAEGEHRALEAAEAAINNPLLDNISMKGAKGVIVNITGGDDITLFEVDEAVNRIRDEVDDDANLIFGTSLLSNMEGNLRVSVVATGIEAGAAVTTSNNKIESYKSSLGSNTGAGAAASQTQKTEIEQPIIKNDSFIPPAPQVPQAQKQEVAQAEPEIIEEPIEINNNAEPKFFEKQEKEFEAANDFQEATETAEATPEVPAQAQPQQQNSGSSLFNSLFGKKNAESDESASSGDQPAETANVPAEAEDDDLEIPAFLRRK